jgi:hypothetical protein
MLNRGQNKDQRKSRAAPRGVVSGEVFNRSGTIYAGGTPRCGAFVLEPPWPTTTSI